MQSSPIETDKVLIESIDDDKYIISYADIVKIPLEIIVQYNKDLLKDKKLLDAYTKHFKDNLVKITF